MSEMINGRRRSLRNSSQPSSTALIPVVTDTPAINQNTIPTDIIGMF